MSVRQAARLSSIVACVALVSAGCSSREARLQQHREKFESLGSSTAAIAEAWLSGSTSATYTAAALRETFLLVEQEREALATDPEALADPTGAELSQAAERLARVVAGILAEVQTADAATVRTQLHDIPITAARK